MVSRSSSTLVVINHYLIERHQPSLIFYTTCTAAPIQKPSSDKFVFGSVSTYTYTQIDIFLSFNLSIFILNLDIGSTLAITGVPTGDDIKDDYEEDLVMPGFRFHPTEDELIEFYLRRKVEGKKFNVELITSIDLYRFDPWELPALAAIGEKEWFFYVPRDRKYRNGDRPNRVTTSGYWKATGADRLIRNERAQMIGLKKTLVFYSGKAPKGVRTSWIMNEYRLPPPTDTGRHQKAEISLCKVYKRAGVEDKQQQPKVEDDCVVATPLPSLTQLMEHGGDSQQQQEKQSGLGSASSSSSMIIDTDEINRILGYHRALVHQHNQYLPLMQQPQLASLSTVTPNSLAAISNKLWEWNSVQEIAKKYTGFKG